MSQVINQPCYAGIIEEGSPFGPSDQLVACVRWVVVTWLRKWNEPKNLDKQKRTGTQKYRKKTITVTFIFCNMSYDRERALILQLFRLWGSDWGQGQAVLPFDIWLHSEVILFYPMLSSWCISLNKKAQKELYERRQQQIRDEDISFIFFLYFLGSTTIQWVKEFSLNTIEMVESPSQGV